MKQKGFVLLPVIVIVILIGAVAYLFYQNSQLRYTSETFRPTVTNLATNFPSNSFSPKPTPTRIPATLKPTPKVVPTATPFGLNDPVAPDGHCYPPENSWWVPPKGDAPLYVSLFNESGGFDYKYAATVGYQWDFDGNGTWDTDLVTGSVTSHIYTQNGTYKPKLRARSSKNTWSPTCDYEYTVVVGETPEYTNDVISIDKVNVSVSISKSSQQKVVGFIISTKNSAGPVRFEGDDINNYNHSYGITESTGANLNEGMSYPFHLFANQSTPNGTYSRDAKVQYTTDNGTVWHDGPVIHYTITVSD